MHTRFRAVATALLLTVSAGGVAVSSGSAQAVGSHGAGAARASALTVTITSTKAEPKLSTDTIRPGKTMFRVVRGNTGGSMQVLRLKSGYSLHHANADFGKAFGQQTDVQAVRRIDKNVVFYGGMPVPAKGDPATKFGVDIDKAGTYYVVNLDRNNLTTLKAKGTHQKRPLPSTTGYLNMKTDSSGANAWSAPKSDPHKGWMKTTNNAAEPHFVILAKVKQSTTNQDVRDYLSNPQGQPPFLVGPELDTLIVSPGHTMVWKYSTSKGKYMAACFWPSKKDGTPHFFMGMFKLLQLN